MLDNITPARLIKARVHETLSLCCNLSPARSKRLARFFTAKVLTFITAMVLAKVIVLASLCCLANAASVSTTSAPSQGYVSMNFGIRPKCYPMRASNNICPTSLANHDVVGVNANLKLYERSLQAVKLKLKAVDFFKDSQSCRDDLRDFACSNAIMKCRTSPNAIPYGVVLSFDVARTRNACARVKKSCSAAVQGVTIYNCGMILTDPMEFTRCVKQTPFSGDFCPSSDYLHCKVATKFYATRSNSFKAMLAKYSTAIKDAACKKEVRHAYCQILRGGICSADKFRRIYAISQQECSAVMKRCVTNPGIQSYFVGACLMLPDATTAAKEALPPVPTVPSTAVNVGK